MKSKAFSKKLSLNKTTVSNIKDQEMVKVVGGGVTNDGCKTVYYTYCYEISCAGTCYVSCSCNICPW